MSDSNPTRSKPLRPIPGFIFASRWLQLPLYVGLIAAQVVYVFHFLVELKHLIEAVFGSSSALQALVSSIGYKTDVVISSLNETIIMLVVWGLIDVVMISNLLIMVIIGGYHTFVAKIHFSEQNPPDWLDHVNTYNLKLKLAFAIISISGVHALKTYLSGDLSLENIQIVTMVAVIHFTFVLSAIGISFAERLTREKI